MHYEDNWDAYALPAEPPYEKRYTYLDRALLEFMFAVPREQLVRPGQRRSLMRRALVNIVPDELLNRRRKAYVARAPIAAISTEWSSLVETSQHMLMSSLGVVDAMRFGEALHKARQGVEVPVVALMRTFGIEIWLRNLTATHVWGDAPWREERSFKQALPQRDGAAR